MDENGELDSRYWAILR